MIMYSTPIRASRPPSCALTVKPQAMVTSTNTHLPTRNARDQSESRRVLLITYTAIGSSASQDPSSYPFHTVDPQGTPHAVTHTLDPDRA